MRRRQILAAAGSASLLAGWTALSTEDTETYGTNEYSFAGLAVIVHPSAVENQSLELTAELRSDGEIITEKSTTVPDDVYDVVLTIHEGLSPHTTYTVTVRTPNASKEIATDELRRDPDEKLVGETVASFFDRRLDDIDIWPRVVQDDWPASGVDVYPQVEGVEF